MVQVLAVKPCSSAAVPMALMHMLATLTCHIGNEKNGLDELDKGVS